MRRDPAPFWRPLADHLRTSGLPMMPISLGQEPDHPGPWFGLLGTWPVTTGVPSANMNRLRPAAFEAANDP